MISWLKVIAIQSCLLLALYVTKETEQRRPASIISKGAESCFKLITSFRSKREFSTELYEQSYSYYHSAGIDPKQSEFSSVEDFSAWLDQLIAHEDISFGQYFSSRKNRHLFKRFIMKRSMPGEFGKFLFHDYFTDILRKSVKVDTSGIEAFRSFRLIYAQKLANEALAKMYNEPEGKFSLFMKSKTVRIFSDVVAWIPPFFGLPPLKLPQFVLKHERRLLKARDMDEFKEIFLSLSTDEQGALLDKKYYDIFSKYYTMAIAGFYSIYSFYEVYDVVERKSFVLDLNESIDQGINDLKYLNELSNPSCESLNLCIEEYRSEWEGQGDMAFNQAKADCFILYDIPKICEE